MTTWVKWLIFSENSAIRTNYPLEVASKRALEFYTYFLKQPLLLGLGLWPRLCRFLEPEYARVSTISCLYMFVTFITIRRPFYQIMDSTIEILVLTSWIPASKNFSNQ